MDRSSCVHCGNRFAQGEGTSRGVFCCLGCETVYRMLSERGLSEPYYRLRRSADSFRRPTPVRGSDRSYLELDDPAFIDEYAERLPEELVMEFYAEGVHCTACLWLLERLDEFVAGVRTARLDLGRALLRVSIDPERTTFSAVARQLDQLGYRPHPVRGGEVASRLRKAEERGMLLKAGVAAACAGNIMILSVSLYGGADGAVAQLFRWASLLLILPVVFYSSLPFYKGSWSAIRGGRMSIDLPVAVAVLGGALASTVNVILGALPRAGGLNVETAYPVYFDSIASLVFLLLLSRYVLRRIQSGALDASDLQRYVLVPTALRVDPVNGELRETRTELLGAGDVIEIRADMRFPADGEVIDGESSVNEALITGEPLPRALRRGDHVHAGTVNLGDPVRVRVTAAGRETRIGRLLAAAETEKIRRSPIVTAADRAARWFVTGVSLASAALVFVGVFTSWLEPMEAFRRALALLIVACPCALGLATPLSFSVSLGRAARRGFLLKDTDAIERFAAVHTVFLDKTGTLTEGRFRVSGWVDLEAGMTDERRARLRAAIGAVEAHSKHPVGRAIASEFRRADEAGLAVHEVKERAGFGISGVVRGTRYELRRARTHDGRGLQGAEPVSAVEVHEDGVPMARILLGDRIRDDSAEAVGRLKRMGYRVRMLTGDARETADFVAGAVGLTPAETIAEATPETKRDAVRSVRASLMVGDGANDSPAMGAASASVAVHGSAEVSLRISDACVSEPGVSAVADLLEICRETLRVIRRGFIFSATYNSLGATAALMGWITPLAAAVLMPVSALTVFVSTLTGTRRLRRLSREKGSPDVSGGDKWT